MIAFERLGFAFCCVFFFCRIPDILMSSNSDFRIYIVASNMNSKHKKKHNTATRLYLLRDEVIKQNYPKANQIKSKPIKIIYNTSHIMLSVSAKPFHPVHGKEIDTIIYNDGIPSMSLRGVSDTEFLHSMLTDEVMDDAYPPSAAEAAELDAVETFVALLAQFSILEEREEQTRLFGAAPTTTTAGGAAASFLGKRWCARRELVDKPHPAKHSIQPVLHNHTQQPELLQEAGPSGAASKETLLVLPPTDLHSLTVKDHKIQQRELARMARHNAASSNNKTNWNRHQQKGNKIPIQQPRKFT